MDPIDHRYRPHSPVGGFESIVNIDRISFVGDIESTLTNQMVNSKVIDRSTTPVRSFEAVHLHVDAQL